MHRSNTRRTAIIAVILLALIGGALLVRHERQSSFDARFHKAEERVRAMSADIAKDGRQTAPAPD